MVEEGQVIVSLFLLLVFAWLAYMGAQKFIFKG